MRIEVTITGVEQFKAWANAMTLKLQELNGLLAELPTLKAEKLEFPEPIQCPDSALETKDGAKIFPPLRIGAGGEAIPDDWVFCPRPLYSNERPCWKAPEGSVVQVFVIGRDI